MLEFFLTVDKQILIMVLMVIVGYFVYKKGLVSDKGLSDMSQLLLKIVVPMIMISSFRRPFSWEMFGSWGIALGISVLSYVILIMIASLAYRDKTHSLCPENRLALVFSNNGFMAIPLMMALAGTEGVFLGSTNIIFQNILFWTYGTYMLRPGTKLQLKQAFINPGTISVVLGLLLFISPWKLPEPVFEAVDAIGSLNTPIAMMVLGGFLAKSDMRTFLKTGAFYKISAIKLIVIPCVMFLILRFLPLSNNIKIVTAICSVMPTGTALSMLTEFYNRDFRYASGAVMITTVISAVTISLMMTLAKLVLEF